MNVIRCAFLEPGWKSKKEYTIGTHRSRYPAETLQAYMPFMPKMGITRLANLTGLDRIGLAVYQAVRPNGKALSGAQGKGFERDAAKASALMESIEGWHGENVGLPRRHATYGALREVENVVDIEQLPRFRDDLIRNGTPIENRELEWVQGYDLMADRATWVPYDTVSTDLADLAVKSLATPFPRTSNGLASGNHYLEAILHAVCEMIERDAWMLWVVDNNSARAKECQIDPATVDDLVCVRILELLAKAEIKVGIWDITSDINIPTYAASINDDPNWMMLSSFAGFGCHLDPGIALARALAEAVQSRGTSIAGSRDDMLDETGEVYSELGEYASLALNEIQSPPPTRNFKSRQSLAAENFKLDLDFVLEALRKVGITTVVAVDLAKSDFGIPVVKMVIPGLEGEQDVACPGSRLRHLQSSLAEGRGRYNFSYVLNSLRLSPF
jgi:YcaO-like protein with predicted kinase domain